MKQATKWVLLAPELYLAPGGIARVSRHYLQALAENRADRELSVVVLNDASITDEQLQSAGAAGVAALGCNKSKIRCAWSLWKETARQPVHVTCTHVALSPLLVLLSWFRRGLTFDIVIHGIEVWKALPRGQRNGLRQAHLILSVSDFTRRDLVSRYPWLDAHCQVLPNALDPSFAIGESETASKSAVPGRVLTVSRLAEHDWGKGIDHLIQALPAARRRRQDIHLHIVGDGVDRSRLEQIAREIEDPESVTFLGRVDDDHLKDELAACELFALPSRKEGFGLVYLEAMAAGKPCIVANAGGAPEVIDSDSGVVVPYGDVPFLADTVVAALRSKWDANKIRSRAAGFGFPAFVGRWKFLTENTV